MLILERKQGESVDLTDRRTGKVLATVKIMETLPDGSIRLGFNAGRDVIIMRDNAKQRRNTAPVIRDPHSLALEQRPAVDGDDDNRGNR